ncbi:von Willebrand factor A domain-containing protein 3B-like isoform X1 [Biomphalaria pfeifferi]|uniref:von Willebrand factor A domain-containing protein 3B-like isoform X1 n=1 Tax=Biomphalaria pfeifferi TaxID=112525 RepID=A0AAD8B101_BIOPF|nr:von Willebrand factor A domain-containing protein 3B-like isoform X1 [Biomphalaria pfeifferi]
MTAVSQRVSSFSFCKKTVTFDLTEKTKTCNHKLYKLKPEGENIILDLPKTARPREWELDVRPLISSQKWLQNYGLRKNRLQLNQILVSIGFKISDEFDDSLKKPVSSRYGSGLFKQMLRPDGRTFNINCSKEKLTQLVKRLEQVINLFKRRLEWLTSESRRLFGVIEERSVTIVLDIQSSSAENFDKYRAALEKVLKEQVSQLSKFNIIRTCEDVKSFSKHCIPVSHDTIDAAIQWLWNLNPSEHFAISSVAESVLMAIEDYNSEAVYLYTEGSAITNGKEILMEKVSKAERKIPIHAVSFNCDSTDVIKFLKDFAKTTKGRFHAYGLVMELETYETEVIDTSLKRANIILRHKTIGGIPPGAGMREDVILIFEELEEARSNLAQIRSLLDNAPEPRKNIFENLDNKMQDSAWKDEQYMSSKEWLEVYGLIAKKLGLDDILSSVAFKHSDGVFNKLLPPSSEPPTDAVSVPVLVNALYCQDLFPVVKWKDGQTMHVIVTPETFRSYEIKVMVVLNKIQQRIDWLNRGSRLLFGTLVEDQMYILIDVSASIRSSLGFIKQKIFALMQEQLRHKKKFNFIAFNSKISGWKDRLVEVSESSMQSAWAWIQSLTCWGSTNTYAALQQALADPQTQAIYLLTDGRPDQPAKSILAQVQFQKNIPIHTISFNCDDVEANQFLYSLAEITAGRYHYFSENGENVEYPKAWQSVDVQLLKDEIKRGLENINKLSELRDECTRLVWQRGADDLRKSLQYTRETDETTSTEIHDLKSSQTQKSFKTNVFQPMPSLSPRFNTASLRNHPKSFYGIRTEEKQSVAKTLRQTRSASLSYSRKTFKVCKRLDQNAHTKTSMMRTLSSSGRFSPNEWLLPETKYLFNRQENNQKLAMDKKKEKQRNKNIKKMLKSYEMSSKQWLSKHGLHAKRLTLLDALGSTLVPHKPKYISILDKLVSAKVFDDVFTLCHISKDQHINLINPNGVNLVEYEKKLKIAIEKFRRRLNKMIWNVLPESEKKEFNSEVPVSFEENSARLLNYLESADWPVKKKDIDLLIIEIKQGEKFLRQSIALREAAMCKDDDAEESFNEGDVDLNQTDSTAEQRQVSSQSNLTTTSSQVLDQSTYVRKEYSEVSETTKSSKIVKKVVKTEDMQKSVKKKVQFCNGQKVIARLDEDGLYYPAEVIKWPDVRHAVVRYFENGEATVYTRHVVPTGGAVARPFLHVGDYVLIRVVNLDNGRECYVPAIVRRNHEQYFCACQCYTVVLYNGQVAVTMRQHLVKISKERFELAVMYICKKLHEDIVQVEENLYVSHRQESEVSESEEDERTTPDPVTVTIERQSEPERTTPDPVTVTNERQSEFEIIRRELRRLKRELRQMQNLCRERSVRTMDQSVQHSLEDDTKSKPILDWRRSLNPIKKTDVEVLARWLDDGWYYRSEIRRIYGDCSYDVVDSTGMTARLWREDIITEEDDERNIEVDDTVIALYPDYCFSYAPGRVINIDSNEVKVRFFNGKTATVPLSEVYKIIPEKYKMDVKHIEKKEKQLIGTAVVARDDHTGAYFPGTVREKCGGQDYRIEWASGSESVQNVAHIFGGFTREPKLSQGDRILACVDPIYVKFLPGIIQDFSENGKLTIKFCNGEIVSNIHGPWYWLSQEYYQSAQEYYETLRNLEEK